MKLDFCQTFDDGPTDATPTLLDFLDSVNQKNTFFEIGSRIIVNYPSTQREYASGHEIAVHTWSHPDLTTLTPEEVYAELAWTIYAIHSAIGQTPKLFRPPFGSINNVVRQVAAQLGLQVLPPSQTIAHIGCSLE
jgi:peptidoglycan/xylan/chitin deacetylase (PgdA/CDA1 family)